MFFCILYGTVYGNIIVKYQNTGLVIWILAGCRSAFHCGSTFGSMVSFRQGIRATRIQIHAELVNVDGE